MRWRSEQPPLASHLKQNVFFLYWALFLAVTTNRLKTDVTLGLSFSSIICLQGVESRDFLYISSFFSNNLFLQQLSYFLTYFLILFLKSQKVTLLNIQNLVLKVLSFFAFVKKYVRMFTNLFIVLHETKEFTQYIWMFNKGSSEECQLYRRRGFVVSFDTIPPTKCKKQPSANKGLQSNGIHSMSIVNANVLINILPE